MAKFPTLAQLSTTYKSLAVARAPRKTGNLKNKLEAYNRPSGMVRVLGKDKFELVLDVAPPGAEYGKYWNDPNVSYQVANQTTGNNDKINFAKQALNSPELKKQIELFMNGKVEELLKEEMGKIGKVFTKAFKGKR
jgi:hypothetical protein